MTDIKALQLHIIKRVLETEDGEILQTIAKILNLQEPAAQSFGFENGIHPSQHTQELQDAINEIFGIMDDHE